MNPIFSIIMTSYNYESYVGFAIESVIAQSFEDWELIIVDDCSNDNSWEVISKYTDSRIRKIRLESNRGGSFAYNKGLSLSKGDLVACLDSDDEFLPDKLKIQWEFMQANPEVEICGTWINTIVTNEGVNSPSNSNANFWFNQSLDFNDPITWVWQNRLCHSSVVIKKSLHERIGQANLNLVYTPDWDLWIRALVTGAKICVIEKPLTICRQHGENITHKNLLKKIEEYSQISAVFLNPYLISKSRFDLIKDNLNGFITHPLSNRLQKTRIVAQALGIHSPEVDTDLNIQTNPTLIALSCSIEKNEEIATARDEALAARDEALAARDEALAARDEALAARDEALVELYGVYRSNSWKITRPIRLLVTNYKLFIRAFKFIKDVFSIITFNRLKKALEYIRKGSWRDLKLAISNKISIDSKATRKDKFITPITSSPLTEGQPLVSIVIPCFNYGAFVTDAIDSVLAQTIQNIEIIVVDGGSDDLFTTQVLSQISRPKTTILFREGRHFVGDNRNYGIERAKGRYVCCLDADDTLDPTYLEKALFHLETYGYDIVSTSINFVGAKQGECKVLEFPDLNDMVEGNHVLTCAVFRRQLWKESLGGYVDVGLGKHHVAEDWDFWLRLATMGARIRNISNEALFNYRIHLGGSLSSSPEAKPLAEQKKLILDRNRELLTPEAFSMSTILKSKNLWCKPSQTSLALNFNTDALVTQKTLLLVMPFCMVGGAERLLSGLCVYLASNGWKIIVVTTLDQNPSFGSSIDWFRLSSSEVYELPRFLEQEEKADFIQYLITARKPDCILNAGSVLFYELLPLIKKSHKSICIVDLLFNCVGHVNSHIEFKKFLTYALAENQEVYDWYFDVAGWPANRIRKMSSGVDLNKLQPTTRPMNLVNKYAISENELIVGFSGRLSEEKAPDVFVEIARLCQDIPNLRFVMTGAGPMVNEVTKKLKKLPSTVKFAFAGLVEDVSQYLALYDLLVLPSRLDGRPLVVMEALACGVPVLASNVGGIPDLIADGKNGYLVEAANANMFAEKIRTLAADREMLAQFKINARLGAEISLDCNDAYRGYEIALSEAIDMHKAIAITT